MEEIPERSDQIFLTLLELEASCPAPAFNACVIQTEAIGMGLCSTARLGVAAHPVTVDQGDGMDPMDAVNLGPISFDFVPTAVAEHSPGAKCISISEPILATVNLSPVLDSFPTSLPELSLAVDGGSHLSVGAEDQGNTTILVVESTSPASDELSTPSPVPPWQSMAYAACW